MADTSSQTLDVQQLLVGPARNIESFPLVRKAQAQSPDDRRQLERLVIELMENPTIDGKPIEHDEAALIIGVGLWALGRLEEAIASLASASSFEADCFLAQCYLETGFFEKAAEAFERAQRGKAATKRVAAIGHAEAILKATRTEPALNELRALAKSDPDNANVHYLLGLAYDNAGRYGEATPEYEKALGLEPHHDAASFRLALNAALRGDEERALEHYEAVSAGPATYTNALVNLGVLHEDRREYQKAIECFRRVLRADPTHSRARMFLKDAHASLDMVYDEDRQREMERRAQLMSVPISDFELSVRVRNCLQRMNIHTLGDLVRHTEEELLASKNFGETSLAEIREMLALRNLRLGLDREEPAAPVAAEEEAAPAEAVTADEAALSTPIGQLDLSLRSRKCMERLGIATVGQLVAHTGEELLASRNFGRTSLTEIAEKLARYGLRLKESPLPPGDEGSDEEGATNTDAQ
jgi:DNA-directed RNA polymerase subunit alpha